ncbi:MAG: hypothetical protein BYD32DRAFT_406631 [Podila humilis]|nr:MAG: hypothetical protein BYD32DRAFT_406631 [Podila humilis]
MFRHLIIMAVLLSIAATITANDHCGTILGIPCPKGYTCIYPEFCAECEGICKPI